MIKVLSVRVKTAGGLRWAVTDGRHGFICRASNVDRASSIGQWVVQWATGPVTFTMPDERVFYDDYLKVEAALKVENYP